MDTDRDPLFVATGDSFTEGLDDGPGGLEPYRGWADRTALALAATDPDVDDAPPASGPRLRYANLAVRGRLLDEVAADQLTPALGMSPDLLAFHGGGNDVLRPGVDVGDLARRYELAVRRAVEGAGTVLLFTVIERSGDGSPGAERLAARIGGFNDAIRRVASTHGAVLVDQAAIPVLQDARLWAADRLHLTSAGHARVAAATLAALGVHADPVDVGLDPDDPTIEGTRPDDAALDDGRWWRGPLPAAPPRRTRDRLAEDGRWLAQHVVPWVVRRLRGRSSGDGRSPKRPLPSPVLDPGTLSPTTRSER